MKYVLIVCDETGEKTYAETETEDNPFFRFQVGDVMGQIMRSPLGHSFVVTNVTFLLQGEDEVNEIMQIVSVRQVADSDKT